MNMRPNSKHDVFGVGLVEVLVALVVVSIGMLGIAALQVETLRSSRTAILRSQAVILAGDIADRIRANKEVPTIYSNAAASINAACQPGGTGCAPSALAQHDKAVWLSELAARLPGGTGTIAVDATTIPDTYTITVTWTEQGGNQSYILRMQV